VVTSSPVDVLTQTRALRSNAIFHRVARSWERCLSATLPWLARSILTTEEIIFSPATPTLARSAGGVLAHMTKRPDLKTSPVAREMRSTAATDLESMHTYAISVAQGNPPGTKNSSSVIIGCGRFPLCSSIPRQHVNCGSLGPPLGHILVNRRDIMLVRSPSLSGWLVKRKGKKNSPHPPPPYVLSEGTSGWRIIDQSFFASRRSAQRDRADIAWNRILRQVHDTKFVISAIYEQPFNGGALGSKT